MFCFSLSIPKITHFSSIMRSQLRKIGHHEAKFFFVNICVY
jgi:hypothetical protein